MDGDDMQPFEIKVGNMFASKHHHQLRNQDVD